MLKFNFRSRQPRTWSKWPWVRTMAMGVNFSLAIVSVMKSASSPGSMIRHSSLSETR